MIRHIPPFQEGAKKKNGHLILAASLYIFGAAGIRAMPKLLIVLHLELLIGNSKLRGETDCVGDGSRVSRGGRLSRSALRPLRYLRERIRFHRGRSQRTPLPIQ